MAYQSKLATLIERVLIWWYDRQGWTVIGPVPEPRKYVVIAAPHTSNWDFVYFIGATRKLGAQLSFMGKKQMFRWPFAKAMTELGGIPVDRSSSKNYVQQMVEEFRNRAEFMLTIAPEGTRGKVRHWKTGFYHIAMEAGVPLVFGVMDYKLKVVGIKELFHPTGDYEADMVKIRSFYAGYTPRHPHQSSSNDQDAT